MPSAHAVRAGRAYVELYTEQKQFQEGLKSAIQKISRFGEQAAKLSRVTITVAIASAYPISRLINEFAKFDDKMKVVQATTRATGEEFKNLEGLARKLGRETSFTAQQVASGMVSLGRAGLKPNEIQDTLGNFMNLARATATNLPRAIEIATATMRGFNMESTEAAHITDVLTVTANASAQTLDDLGEAFKYVIPVAKSAEMSIEDAAKATALLANMGIKGSMAATGIRNILLRMSQTSIQELYKKELGVDVIDSQTGKLRKFGDVMNDVAAAAQKLPSGKRLEIFREIFGMYGLASGTAFASDVDFSDVFKKIDNASGEAQRIADDMDSGIGGTIRLAISKLADVGLFIGQQITPELMDLGACIDDIANRTKLFIASNRQLLVQVVEFNKSIITSALGAAKFVASLAAANPLMTKLISNVAALSPFVYVLVKGFQTLTGVCKNIYSTFDNVSKAFYKLAGGNHLDERLQELNVLYEDQKKQLEESTKNVEKYFANYKRASQNFVNVVNREKEELKKAREAGAKAVEEAVGKQKEAVAKAADAEKKLTIASNKTKEARREESNAFQNVAYYNKQRNNSIKVLEEEKRKLDDIRGSLQQVAKDRAEASKSYDIKRAVQIQEQNVETAQKQNQYATEYVATLKEAQANSIKLNQYSSQALETLPALIEKNQQEKDAFNKMVENERKKSNKYRKIVYDKEYIDEQNAFFDRKDKALKNQLEKQQRINNVTNREIESSKELITNAEQSRRASLERLDTERNVLRTLRNEAQTSPLSGKSDQTVLNNIFDEREKVLKKQEKLQVESVRRSREAVYDMEQYINKEMSKENEWHEKKEQAIKDEKKANDELVTATQNVAKAEQNVQNVRRQHGDIITEKKAAANAAARQAWAEGRVAAAMVESSKQYMYNTQQALKNTAAKIKNVSITRTMAMMTSRALTAAAMIGTAMAAIGFLVSGKNTIFANTVNKQAEAAKEQSEALKQRQEMERQQIERLKEINNLQEIFNSQSRQEEAAKIISRLTNRYNNLGLEIDRTTGKVVGLAEAQKKLEDAQGQQTEEDLENEIKKLKAQKEGNQKLIEGIVARNRLFSSWAVNLIPTTRKAEKEWLGIDRSQPEYDENGNPILQGLWAREREADIALLNAKSEVYTQQIRDLENQLNARRSEKKAESERDNNPAARAAYALGENQATANELYNKLFGVNADEKSFSEVYEEYITSLEGIFTNSLQAAGISAREANRILADYKRGGMGAVKFGQQRAFVQGRLQEFGSAMGQVNALRDNRAIEEQVAQDKQASNEHLNQLQQKIALAERNLSIALAQGNMLNMQELQQAVEKAREEFNRASLGDAVSRLNVALERENQALFALNEARMFGTQELINLQLEAYNQAVATRKELEAQMTSARDALPSAQDLNKDMKTVASSGTFSVRGAQDMYGSSWLKKIYDTNVKLQETLRETNVKLNPVESYCANNIDASMI